MQIFSDDSKEPQQESFDRSQRLFPGIRLVYIKNLLSVHDFRQCTILLARLGRGNDGRQAFWGQLVFSLSHVVSQFTVN